MRPGTKGHTRIQFQNDVSHQGTILTPGGFDYNFTTDFLGFEKRFPGLGPVLFIQFFIAEPVNQGKIRLIHGQSIFQNLTALIRLAVLWKITDNRMLVRARD